MIETLIKYYCNDCNKEVSIIHGDENYAHTMSYKVQDENGEIFNCYFCPHCHKDVIIKAVCPGGESMILKPSITYDIKDLKGKDEFLLSYDNIPNVINEKKSYTPQEVSKKMDKIELEQESTFIKGFCPLCKKHIKPAEDHKRNSVKFIRTENVSEYGEVKIYECPHCKKEIDSLTINLVYDDSSRKIDFTINVNNMRKDWADHFCSMLRLIERNGNIGHSEYVGIFSDGDGDFRPSFDINYDYDKKEPEKDSQEYKMFDRG